MKFLTKSKDGGPKSPVDAFFLIEHKKWFSVALLKFNEGGREAYHTHAFNAYTWFLFGDLEEEDISGARYKYKRSVLPKYTPRSKNHRVYANKTSWCFTIRGPWIDVWTEDLNGTQIKLTHGRKVID